MNEALLGGRHVAIFANPDNGAALPALAVVEQLVGRGDRVTYVTSSEIAARFVLSGASADQWDVMGCLDDTDEPAAIVLGYFEDDQPDIVVHDASARMVARTCARGWGLFTGTNRDIRPFDEDIDRLVMKFGFVIVPELAPASQMARH